MNSKREIIEKRREEIIKRYGSPPRAYSSGIGVNSEKEKLSRIRINLNPEVIKQSFPEIN